MSTSIKNKAIILSDYYISIGLLSGIQHEHFTYNNMGATIIDAILQSGMRYETVVLPRVNQFLSRFSSFKTTCDFLILMDTIPLNILINWKNGAKPLRITNLTWFLYKNDIHTEADLREWIINTDNQQELLKMNGIGEKTVDYLMSLVGVESVVAVDRHLFRFLMEAGINYRNYNEAHQIYLEMANVLGISPYQIDKQVWNYMISKANH